MLWSNITDAAGERMLHLPHAIVFRIAPACIFSLSLPPTHSLAFWEYVEEEMNRQADEDEGAEEKKRTFSPSREFV